MVTPAWLDWLNFFVGAISIILGVVSLALAVVFFLAAKKAETATAKTLVAIDQNVNTLKTINSGLIERLIGHMADSNREMLSKWNANVRGATGATGATGSPGPAPAQNIRQSVLDEINYLKATTGRVTAMELTQSLERLFPFTVIFNELTRMQKDGVITWEGAPHLPDAHSHISIVEPIKDNENSRNR